MIDKDRLLSVIDAKAEHAYGSEFDMALSKHRSRMIEAYLGYNVNPAPEGRSQVVDRSVFETIQTMLPSLVRIYASSTDEVVKFMPIGPEDEAGADQTTKFINYVATQLNPWEQFCSDWIHDALLLGNSYAMAYWDDNETTYRETYEGQTDEQLALIIDDGDEVKVIQHTQRPDEDQNEQNQKVYQQQMLQYQQMAQMAAQKAAQMAQQPLQPGQQPQLSPPPQPPQPKFLHDIVIEKTEKEGKVKLCVLPPEHCLISSDTPDWTLERCEYFEFREEKTIADLRQMGFDVDEDISDETKITDSPEDFARNRFLERPYKDPDASTGMMRKVIVRSIWVRADAEDDQPRMYYVICVGRTILYAEACSRIPVVSMTPQPLPHRHPGLSIAEIVISDQEVKTAIKRGGLDNLYLANNGRYAISDKVNLDDFLDSRPGGVVRLVDGALPGQGHVMPLEHPFAFDSIIGALEYFDQDRQNKTGATRYFSGTDAGAINKTASGTAMLQNAASMRIEHIARMFAPAFETLFSIIHEITSKHQQKDAVVKLTNKWVDIDPLAWKTKRDVKISVGVGAGNKESMLQALSMQAQEQMAMAQAGIVKPENLYQTMIEKSKLQGFSNPMKFWTDPTTQPKQPQPPPPELLKIQAEQQQSQVDAQLEAMKVKVQKETAERNAAVQKYQADIQAQTQKEIEAMRLASQEKMKQYEMHCQAEMKGADMQHEAMLKNFDAERTSSLEKEKIRLNKDPNPDATDRAELALQHFANMGNQIQSALETMHGHMKNMMTAQKRVKRGKDGKVEGVEVISPDGELLATQGVVRGPDGKITGVQ